MTKKELQDIALMSDVEKIKNSLNLTDRQKEIFDYVLVRGLTYKAVYIETGWSESTVRDDVRVILKKLDEIKLHEI